MQLTRADVVLIKIIFVNIYRWTQKAANGRTRAPSTPTDNKMSYILPRQIYIQNFDLYYIVVNHTAAGILAFYRDEPGNFIVQRVLVDCFNTTPNYVIKLLNIKMDIC